RELVSPAACEEMIGHLLRCEDRHKFRKLLPAGTKVAYKTGSVSNARTAAGLLETPQGTVALCVLTNGTRDRRWTDDSAGDLLCARIAKDVYDYSQSTRPAKSADEVPEVLQIGASGDLVEALQRTLNSRMKPSPDI